jgi:hypothetical protein
MTSADSVNAIGGATSVVDGPAVARGIAKWLCLAATPTFAIMALLESVSGREGPDMLCASAHGISAMSGMVPMYLLMSVFHSGSWLKLIAGPQSGAR